MTDGEAAKLAQPPVSVDAAWRLADFHGICLQDSRGLEKWLRVAASQGDTKAMYSLASIIERQSGRAEEGADWRRKADEARKMEVVFGTTKYLPLTPTPKLANDYVAGAETVVPEVVRRCGGTAAHYRAATDGGAAVVFSPARAEHETVRCIKNTLPQVVIRSASRSEMPCPQPKAGYRCHLTQTWP